MADRYKPPPALTRKGIRAVTDNREGRPVHLPQGLIVTLFGEELRHSRFVKPAAPAPAAKGRKR